MSASAYLKFAAAILLALVTVVEAAEKLPPR